MSAADLADGLVSRRVLVYGSLPPDGRDLDLLAREPEEVALREGLAREQYLNRGSEWVRFEPTGLQIVELVSVADWGLPRVEADGLFDEGLPIAGLKRLVRPSPHHAILILARRVVCGDGMLDPKLRKRLEQALAEDPRSLAEARERAVAWRASVAVEALVDALRDGRAIPADQRARARRERDRAAVSDRAVGWDRALAEARRVVAGRDHAGRARRVLRARRTKVIALSGLDGAGKSSLASALRDTLAGLGYDTIVVRTRIRWDDSLWAVSEPIKHLLLTLGRVSRPLLGRSRGRDRPIVTGDACNECPELPVKHPITRMREQSALATDLWTLVITLANALLQWRLMRRQLLRGGVVICDRYTLDSIVELRYLYGRDRSFRGARAALAVLYPDPVRAYLLDVTPGEALARKGEWGLEWLVEHRALYLQEAPRIGVERLDGQRPLDDLCAQIAREVWSAGT